MAQRLRVGFIGTDLAPLAASAGGLERLVVGWAAGLGTTYETRCYSPYDDRQADSEYPTDGGPSLVRAEQECDVIIINNRPLWTRHVRIPTLLILHNTSDAWGLADSAPLEKPSAITTLGSHVGILAVSQFLARHAQEHLSAPSPPTVLPPFVDRAFSSGPRWNGRDRRLLFPNRLLAKKGVRETIMAAEASSSSDLEVVFLANFAPWAQPTPDHKDLITRIHTSARCSLEPRIAKSSQLARRMADSAAVLAPSTSPEGLGLAPLESLVLGVPTITSSLGGLTELAPFGATVIDPFDVESFADALVEITTSPPQIDSSGVRHAFSIQRSLDTLTEAIEQAIRR